MAGTLPRGRIALVLGLALAATVGWALGTRWGAPEQSDLDDLAEARSADALPDWDAYLARHPTGIARAEAEAARIRLAAREPIDDPRQIADLEERLRQLKEAVARHERPANPLQLAAQAEPKPDARLVEPTPPLPPGRGIDLDPTDPSVAIRWTADGAILRSADGGRSWTPANAGASGWRLDRRALRPEREPRTVFIPAEGGPGIGLLSRDGGGTWRPAPVPWDGSSTPLLPAVLTADGTLVAVHSATGGAEFWTSPDLGATWRTEPSAAVPRALALAGTGTLSLFATDAGALAASTDLGRTRTPLGNSRDLLRDGPLSWDPGLDGPLLRLAVARGAVTVCNRRGAATGAVMPSQTELWDVQNRPLLRALAVDPRDGKRWFAASPVRGLLRSDDGGKTWKALRFDRSVTALSLRRSGKRTLLAATGRATLVLDITELDDGLFTVDPGKLPERSP